MNHLLAISLMPLEGRPEAILRAATGAEERGYDAFFLPETWSHDTTVVLAEIACRTRRIGLGTGVLGIWGRSAGTLAMAAATLHRLSGGRFTLGLGASTPQLAEGFHDVPYGAPFRQMRRVLTQVRALLGGDRIPLAVATSARPLRLNLPPAPDLPIHLAGLADETIRLAGELADGWLPFLYPRDRLVEAGALLAEGAARAGGGGAAPIINPNIPTVVARDPIEARKGAEWFIVFYLTSMGPHYPRTISRLGFDKEVEAIVAANPTRGSTVFPREAEALLDQLTVYGTPEEARARLARWYEAGAHMPILLLPPNLEPDQTAFMLEALR